MVCVCYTYGKAVDVNQETKWALQMVPLTLDLTISEFEKVKQQKESLSRQKNLIKLSS